MKKWLSSIIDFLINTNLLIAIAAVCLTFETQLIFNFDLGIHPYLFIVFFATLFEYNLHKLLTLLFSKNALKLEKHEWLRNHKRFFYFIVTCSCIGLALSVLFATKEVLKGLAPLALLTVFYTIPFIRIKNRSLKLRDIPVFKTALIALIWAVSTAMLPIWQSQESLNIQRIILLMIERFLFVFAICVPFDIRDMEADRQSGLKTLPLMIGSQKSWSFAIYCMYAILPFLFFHYLPLKAWDILLSMLISTFVVVYFLKSEKVRNLRHYHYGVLDGSMILQFVIVFVLHFIANFIQST
jgi:4-hydroxybenzoate polyprenyltransferase